VTLRREAREYGTTAMDFAKRLLDFGFHAPTTYFPLLVPSACSSSPTETESKEELDAFVAAMVAIREEAQTDAAKLKARRGRCRCVGSTTCARPGSSTSPGPRPDA